MCVISNVMDHYRLMFPSEADGDKWLIPPIDYSTLRALIDEFKEAVAAAKKLDVILKQPDCIDPEKAKLQAHVDRLEKVVDALLGARA